MNKKQTNDRLAATVFLWLAALQSFNVQAQDGEEAIPDMDNLSINELMQLKVSSAARKSQSLSETAAAAFVITQDDIRRSGATSIPEALRLAPGIEVAQIGSSRWAITARGFNGQYANKLLVLMDGRTLYTPLFSGVFWDLQDTMMEDIDHIEVIRGPGAVMWGANAVNGVINIITKKAKDTQGDLLVAGGGNQEQGFVGYRHGGQFNGDGNYRVYAKAFEREAFVRNNGDRAHDDWRSAQAGFRHDQRLSSDQRLTVQGDVYRKKNGTNSRALTLGAPYNVEFVTDGHSEGANLLSRWEASLDDGSELMLQGYYDRVGFNAAAVADVQDQFDIDFQHRLHPDPDHDLMWGLNYRFIHNDTTNTAVFNFQPSSLAYHQGGAFVQDDISLIDHTLRLTLGSKIEESHFGHTQVQPNARLLWTPNEQHSVWASVARAARTPSRGAANADVAAGTTSTKFGRFTVPVQIMAASNRDIKAEKVFTAEIGYRAQWTRRFSTDVTAFSSHYDDLIVFRPGTRPPGLPITQPLVWSNLDQEVTTRGIELVADWQVLDWMRFTGSYSHIKIEKPVDIYNSDTAGLSPRHHGYLRWQMDVTDDIDFDTTLRHVSKLSSSSQGVPSYTTFDARLAYRPIKGMEWSVAVQNLFAPQHLEYRDVPMTTLTDSAVAVPRSIYGKLSWNF